MIFAEQIQPGDAIYLFTISASSVCMQYHVTAEESMPRSYRHEFRTTPYREEVGYVKNAG